VRGLFAFVTFSIKKYTLYVRYNAVF